ncbi:hypothetical protein [Streptococcus parasuis]|uniref:hypothetical protein n=1 Tax=Streptococcus parasuis TaxID=1501662 RepID=UPI00370D69F7
MEYYLIVKQFMTYSLMIGFFPILYKSSKKEPEKSREIIDSKVDKNPLVKWLDFVIWFIVFLICGFVVIKFTLFEKNHLFLYIIILLNWITKINEGYYYSEKLINTLKTSNNTPLTKSEWNMIINIAGVIMFISQYEIQEKIIKYFLEIPNHYLSDLLLLLFLCFISMLYLFISGIFIFETFKLMLNLFTKIEKNIFGRNTKLFFDKVERTYHNGMLRTNFSTKFVTENEKNIRKYFILLLLIIIYDVMYQLIYIIFKLINGIIFYILLIILRLRNSYNKMKMWVYSLSDRRVTVMFFRISVIESIICLVTYNRISPLVKMTTESTVILEFISSSIMIPVILSWILEFKKLKDI